MPRAPRTFGDGGIDRLRRVAVALLDGGHGDPAQPVDAAVAEGARRPVLSRNRMAEIPELRRLLHQPGGPLGPEGRDQEVEPERGLVGRGGTFSTTRGGIAVHPRDLPPAGSPLAVHDPQGRPHGDAPGTEEMAVDVALDPGLARVELPGIGEDRDHFHKAVSRANPEGDPLLRTRGGRARRARARGRPPAPRPRAPPGYPTGSPPRPAGDGSTSEGISGPISSGMTLISSRSNGTLSEGRGGADVQERMEAVQPPVDEGIERRGGVDVERHDLARSQQQGGEGEDAGARADVQDPASAEVGVLQQLDRQAGGFMAADAERGAGREPEEPLAPFRDLGRFFGLPGIDEQRPSDRERLSLLPIPRQPVEIRGRVSSNPTSTPGRAGSSGLAPSWNHASSPPGVDCTPSVPAAQRSASTISSQVGGQAVGAAEVGHRPAL